MNSALSTLYHSAAGVLDAGTYDGRPDAGEAGPLKILIASDAYKKQTNGVTNMVVTLAEELRAMDCEVRVLALSDTHASFREGDDYYISSFSSPVYPDARQSLVWRSRYLRELKEWDPDIIHIHTEFSARRLAQQVAHATRTPVVMTCHTDYGKFVEPVLRSPRLIRTLIRAWSVVAYHGADVLTVPSEKGRDITRGYHLRCPVVVIPNGIEQEKFRRPLPPEEREALFARYGMTDNGRLLLSVSRLSREKNLEELLGFLPRLLREEPEARLLVVGDGPDRARLEAAARELGVEGAAVFTGRIPPDEVYRYYRMGSVFVCASRFEVHSLTYLEAMTCGLPLVCREDPCLKDVLEQGGNGFAYRTEEEFLAYTLRVLRDGALRQRLSEDALRRSEAFGGRRYAARTLELYRQVLREHREEA